MYTKQILLWFVIVLLTVNVNAQWIQQYGPEGWGDVNRSIFKIMFVLYLIRLIRLVISWQIFLLRLNY